MSHQVCHDVGQWVEDNVSQQVEKCVEQDCNWWCLCCNKWFCFLVWVIVTIWLAPGWVMLPKLGLILSLRGDHRGANSVLEEAYDLAPRSRRADLLGPLARTKYALGDFDALREIAIQGRSRALFPGAASLYLAAAYIEDPSEDSESARPLLAEARAGLGTEEKQLKAALEKRLGGPAAG